MARTFQGKNEEFLERGKRLFSYMQTFVQLRIPCIQMTQDLLAD
jgi:hypothetical protein